jgi:hypothetical protein
MICGVVLLAGTMAAPASADIIGLTPGTYEYNQGDTGSPALGGTDSIQLTTGGDQFRSIFFHDAQDITQFSASFTYRAADIGGKGFGRHGITFVMQNSPDDVDALGLALGYSGITNSAAITLELDMGVTYSGYFTNGVLGGGAAALTPVNAYSLHEIDVSMVYDGSFLTVSFVDTVTGASQTLPNMMVGSLADVVGGPSAYIGFSGGTGVGGVDQHLSNFTFTSIPAPGVLGLLGVAGLLRGRRRRS